VRLAVGLVLLAPVAWAGARAVVAGADTTYAEVRRWLTAHLNPTDIIVQELYGARLPTFFDDQTLQFTPAFATTSEAARERYFAAPRFQSAAVPMVVSGDFSVNLTDSRGHQHEIQVLEHGSEFNEVFYYPALLRDVDYFVRSEAVAGRYLAEPDRYPVQVRFYGWLNAYAEEVLRSRPSLTRSGPEIVVYRLGAKARENLENDHPWPVSFWWASAIPRKFRERVDQLAPTPEERSEGAVMLKDGRPAPWVRAARPLFERYAQPFLLLLAHYHMVSQHFDSAARASLAVLTMAPELKPAAMIFANVQEARGRPDLAIEALRQTLEIRERRGLSTSAIRLTLAGILARTGKAEEARLVAIEVLNDPTAPEDIVAQTRGLLAKLPDRGP
jgi:hypothetical protein